MLTLLLEDFRVRTYQSQAKEKVCKDQGARYFMNSKDLFGQPIPDSSWSKMSLDCSQAILGMTSPTSSLKWSKGGALNLSRGEFWTVSSSEFPKEGVESSLSQILEENAPPKYSISPTAAAGILRRAQKRGKQLPVPLQESLERVVANGTKAPGDQPGTNITT